MNVRRIDTDNNANTQQQLAFLLSKALLASIQCRNSIECKGKVHDDSWMRCEHMQELSFLVHSPFH